MRMTIANVCIVELARVIKSISSRSGEFMSSFYELIFYLPFDIALIALVMRGDTPQLLLSSVIFWKLRISSASRVEFIIDLSIVSSARPVELLIL